MTNIKVKRGVLYGEILKRYLIGFKHLKYRVTSWTVTYRPRCTLSNFSLSKEFDAHLIHLRKQKITYLVLVCDGFIRFGGPSKDSDCLVLRFEKDIADLDTIENKYKDEYLAALEELYILYDEKANNKEG